MKIIDAHAHIAQYIAGIGSEGELRGIGDGMAQYATGRTFRMIPKNLGDYGFSPEALLDVMDANKISKAVLLQGQYLGFQNIYTYEAIKKYPSRFIGAASYDPFCPKKDEIIKHLFEELNFKIIKLELSTGSGLMSYHDKIMLDGPIFESFLEVATKYNLVVVIDIGRPRNVCWQIDELAKSIKKYSNLTFVLCHLLSPQCGDIMLLEESLHKLKMPNVYFDLASVASNAKPETYPYPTAKLHIESAKKIVGVDHLMFGSDTPSALCRDTYTNLLNYMFDLFTDSEKEYVFFKTANMIYFNEK